MQFKPILWVKKQKTKVEENIYWYKSISLNDGLQQGNIDQNDDKCWYDIMFQ